MGAVGFRMLTMNIILSKSLFDSKPQEHVAPIQTEIYISTASGISSSALCYSWQLTELARKLT